MIMVEIMGIYCSLLFSQGGPSSGPVFGSPFKVPTIVIMVIIVIIAILAIIGIIVIIII